MVVVCFEWKHPGKHVLLAGSFTNWKAYPMIKKSGHWKLELNLPVGFHTFKFVVDGEWVIDVSKPSVGSAPDLLNVVEATAAQSRVRRDRSHETITVHSAEDLVEAVETGAQVQLGDQLEQVHLSHQELSSPQLHNLFEALKANKKVHTVNLSNNGVGDSVIKVLSPLLTQNNLKVLNLWNTNLTDSGATELAAAISKNTSLVSLNLRANGIGPAGSQALAKAVQKHPSLEVVDLWWNPLGDKGMRAWAEVVKEGKVQELHIGGNVEVDKETKKVWVEALKKSKGLQSLHFISYDRKPFASTCDKLSE